MNKDIIEKIREIVTAEIEQINDGFVLGEDDNLFECGMDSVNSMKIIVALEMEYDIEFEDDELLPENIQSLKLLKACIERKTAA